MQVLSNPQLQAPTDEQDNILYTRMSRMVDRVDFHLDELAHGFSHFYKSYYVEKGESRLVSRSLKSLTPEGRIVLSASPHEWATALFFEPLACSANALLHECRNGVYLLVWIGDRGDAEVALYTGSSVDMWFRYMRHRASFWRCASGEPLDAGREWPPTYPDAIELSSEAPLIIRMAEDPEDEWGLKEHLESFVLITLDLAHRCEHSKTLGLTNALADPAVLDATDHNLLVGLNRRLPICQGVAKRRGEVFECRYCDLDFIKVEYLEHLKTEHDDYGGAFQCDICSSTFVERRNLEIHTEIHDENRQRTHACTFPGCGKTYFSACALRYHSVLHERKHVCNICDKVFYSAKILEYHGNVHNGSRPFPCDKCILAFRDPAGLKAHDLRVHQQLKPHKCLECESSFHTKAELLTHERIHDENRKKTKCTICGKEYMDMKVHMRASHSGEIPSCPVCPGKKFTSLRTVGPHIKDHPVCKYCNKMQPYLKRTKTAEAKLKSHERCCLARPQDDDENEKSMTSISASISEATDSLKRKREDKENLSPDGTEEI